MKYTIISNSCIGCSVMNMLKLGPYNNPFIGSMFLTDMDYMKFCKNFNYYIKCKPIFKPPRNNSLWSQQTNRVYHSLKSTYPVMHLDDIEIHWIHENNEKETLIKYNRRLKRFYEQKCIPIFVWVESEMFNIHNDKNFKEIVDNFFSTPNCLFLGSNRYILQSTNNKIFINYYGDKLKNNLKRCVDNVLSINNQPILQSYIAGILRKNFSI